MRGLGRSPAITPLVRAAAAALGVAIFATGVAAVFVTENGTGAAALLTIGAAFVAFAVLGDRIASVELGGVNLSIRDLARQTFSLARDADRRGDTDAADRLRSVGAALEELADEYRRLRSSMRSGRERTSAMDAVVAQASTVTGTEDLDPEEVSEWFHQGKPEARVIALGLMQGEARLRDFDAAIDAIEHSRSAFEQYHGLRLAELMLPGVSRGRQAHLKQVVERAMRSRRLRKDTHRHDAASRILRELG
jgi:hypothetical protein